MVKSINLVIDDFLCYALMNILNIIETTLQYHKEGVI